MVSADDLIEEDDSFILAVVLNHTSPAVTREVIVPGYMPLALLHIVLQIAMGWTDSHLHQFRKGPRIYGIPDEDFPELAITDYSDVRVCDLLSTVNDSILYEYDFGDGWEHTVQLVGVLPAEDEAIVPVCVAGAMACPPEDVGGPSGFEDFKEVIADPDHLRHDELVEWVGWAWSSTDFNIHETNVILGRVFPGFEYEDEAVH